MSGKLAGLGEGNPIHSLEHLALGVSPPIGPCAAGQLHSLYLTGAHQVRAGAQVYEITLAVEGNLLSFAGMLLNQLHLIGLALFLHQLDGFLRLQLKPLQGLILLDNLLHLALNGGQIIGSQVPGQVKIVIKALINRRADGEHRIREQPAYRLGHNMGGRMPIGPFPFLGIKGQ